MSPTPDKAPCTTCVQSYPTVMLGEGGNCPACIIKAKLPAIHEGATCPCWALVGGPSNHEAPTEPDPIMPGDRALAMPHVRAIVRAGINVAVAYQARNRASESIERMECVIALEIAVARLTTACEAAQATHDARWQ